MYKFIIISHSIILRPLHYIYKGKGTNKKGSLHYCIEKHDVQITRQLVWEHDL